MLNNAMDDEQMSTPTSKLSIWILASEDVFEVGGYYALIVGSAAVE